MDAGTKQLADILNGNRVLEVPYYQRSYVWKEDQWSRFLSDMEYITSTGRDYFLGSIILKQQPTGISPFDVQSIIDGQQRFTTFALFFKSLCLKTDDMETFESKFMVRDRRTKTRQIAIRHSINDREDFEKIIALQTDEPFVTSQTSNIIRAYNYFQANINPDKIDIDTLLNHVIFIGISLQPGEDEQVIFDTINSLGVKLTTGELLKNYFFSQETIAEYNQLWKPAFELDDETREFWEQDVTAGRLRRNNIEAFLSAYLQVKIQDPVFAVKGEDKIMFRRSEGLFNNYKRFISDYVATDDMDEAAKKQKIFEFICDLTQYSKIYRNCFNSDTLQSEVGAAPSLDRLNVIIYGLDGTTAIPYLMFIQKNVDDDSEKQNIYEYLESYLMRRIVCKAHNNNYSDLFTENLIGQNIKTADALKDYIEQKDPEASLAMPSNLMVRKAFHNEEMPNKRAAGILYLIETKLRNPALCSTAMLGFNSYSLEHLMPKKWRNNWGIAIDPDNRDFALKTLGNLAIITSSLNSSIRDADWDKKLEGNSKGGLKKYAAGLVTMEAVLNSTNWDEDHISERADWLADKATEIWPSYSAATDDVDEETTPTPTSTPAPDALRTRNTDKVDQTKL